MSDPLGRRGRWARRACAGGAVLLAVVDLVSAVIVPAHRAGRLGVDYAVTALVGAHYVLLAAGLCLLLVVRALLRGKRAAWWVALVAAAASLPGMRLGPGQWPRLLVAGAVLVLLRHARRRLPRARV